MPYFIVSLLIEIDPVSIHLFFFRGIMSLPGRGMSNTIPHLSLYLTTPPLLYVNKLQAATNEANLKPYHQHMQFYSRTNDTCSVHKM